MPELVNNHTEFENSYPYTVTFTLAMNRDVYEGLPDDLREIIDRNSGADLSVFAGGTQADADIPARQLAVDHGNNIITISEADVALWRDAAQPIYDSWLADMQAQGIDGQALLDEARQLMADYQASH